MKLPDGIESVNGIYPALIDPTTKKILIGRWIGSVEVVVGGIWDGTGYEIESELFPAYQLISGRIVFVKEDGSVHSLKKEMHNIIWAYYPDDFKEEWKGCKNIPSPPGEEFEKIETDELPF